MEIRKIEVCESKIEFCESNFHKLITKETSMDYLYADINDIMFNYSFFALDNDMADGREVKNHLVTLRMLRDLFTTEK